MAEFNSWQIPAPTDGMEYSFHYVSEWGAIQHQSSYPYSGWSTSLVINGGETVTNDNDVVLTVYASRGGESATEMRFSNDGVVWSPWEEYGAEKEWKLSPVDGESAVGRTVYAEFRGVDG